MGSENHSTRADVAAGIRQTLPVGMGLIPLGLAFGLLVTQTGFAWWWTPIFSIIVYAGSMEFLAVGLVMAHTGLIGSAVTSFMVNFRHVFYGLTFPRHLIRSRLGRAYSTYALTDESYAIVSATDPAERMSGARLLTIQILCQALWVGSGIIGGLTGAALPEGIRGAEFALVALFAVLAIDAFEASRDFSLPITAVVCTLVGWLINPGQMLVIGLILYFVTLLVRVSSPKVDASLRMTSASGAGAGGAGGAGNTGGVDEKESEK
nr:AzlC family ABC transporter permease [Corynebacterium lactis]